MSSNDAVYFDVESSTPLDEGLNHTISFIMKNYNKYN